jgi:uncharacterized protein YjbI with pentapeptide repeats
MKTPPSERTEIIFLAVMLTLAAGVPIALYSIYFFAESVEILAAVGAIALVLVAIIGVVCVKFRHQLLQTLFGASINVVKSVADPVANAISSFADGNAEEAGAGVREAARGVAAHYVWVKSRQWIVAAATGLLIGFAGIVGSALLKKQNDLILDQNRFFQQQIEQQQLQLELQQSVSNQQVRSEAIRRIYGPEFQSTPRVKAEAVRSLIVVERVRIASGDNTLATDYLNLHNADLKNAWLENSDLENVSFRGSDLTSANFSASSLKNSVFRHTELQAAAFIGSSADNTVFAFCFGIGAVFSNADLTGAAINQCDMSSSSFSGANLSDASFYNVNLKGANFQGVENWRAISSFEGSNIFEIRNAPEGFVEWAMENGAIDEPNALSGLRERAKAAKDLEEGAGE